MSRISREEIANAATHGVGLLLSLAGLTVLVVLAVLRGTAWHVVSCAVYGATLVFMYASSTLYHSARRIPLKRALRVLDHSAIYLLIAGTYTPFTLVTLRGAWGWTLFGLVWGCSLVGIVSKLLSMDQHRWLYTTAYVMTGWLAVVAIKPLWAALSSGGLAWLAAGGAFYTLGAVIYATRKIPYFHAIWHLFVMAGSACHYCAILLYVLPARVGY